MIFKSIAIKNFRGIKSVEIDGLSRINLFLGKNNSGKSSILEAIFLLLTPGNPMLVVSIDNARNVVHDEANDFRFPFYKLDYSNTIEINSRLMARDAIRDLTISPIRDSIVSPNGAAIQKSSTTLNTTTISTLNTRDQEIVNGLEFSAKLKQFQGRKAEYKTSIRFERNNTGFQFQVSPQKNVPNDTILGILQVSGVKAALDLTQRLNEIIVNKDKNDLIEALREIDSRIVDFELGAKNMIYFDIGISRLIPANLMGDGILKLLNIYANIYSTQNGCLLIDEIDNGLHFESLKLLWRMLLATAKKYNCQIFTTSHNFELLKYLAEVLKIDNFSEYQTDIGCYSLIKNEEDNLKSAKYNYENLEFALNHDIEIRGTY